MSSKNYLLFLLNRYDFMQLPERFITQMQGLLGEETSAFLLALDTAPPVSIRYNRHKAGIAEPSFFDENEPVPWCESGYYLPARPVFTLDPLLHAGVYYVQEASSLFLAYLAGQLFTGNAVKCLDLCAAPGGKSTLLADFLPAGSLLAANEVIRPRTAILQENLVKWGNPNVVVTNNDPKDFAALPHFFDVLLIDAPCSGEGMFRKDPAAVSEWSPANVQLCAERQRRIVADAWETLAPDGILLYSTCTYNRTENEDNVQWICETLGAELLHVPVPSAWNITESEGGYRFYPHKTKGEGFFVSVLRKTGCNAKKTSAKYSTKSTKAKQGDTLPLPKEIQKWLKDDFIFKRRQEKIVALPVLYEQEMNLLQHYLHVWQAGVAVAEVKGKDVIPDIALALSDAVNKNAFPLENVDLLTAQRYLRRENILLPNAPKGFILISYKNQPLGFVKNLGMRANNLFPTAWRIRMSL